MASARCGSIRHVPPGALARAPGEIGQIVIKGPNGCRYLDDVERQAGYVRDGWNMSGDLARIDEDGYIDIEARTDDMILHGG